VNIRYGSVGGGGDSVNISVWKCRRRWDSVNIRYGSVGGGGHSVNIRYGSVGGGGLV
jgi:hypothetical protein